MKIDFYALIYPQEGDAQVYAQNLAQQVATLLKEWGCELTTQAVWPERVKKWTPSEWLVVLNINAPELTNDFARGVLGMDKQVLMVSLFQDGNSVSWPGIKTLYLMPQAGSPARIVEAIIQRFKP